MERIKNIRPSKMLIALLLVGATHIALGSFTGSSAGRSRQFSLKDFNRNFYRPSTIPFSLRAGFQYRGSQILKHRKEANGTSTITSVLKFERGNTTYIYPYKHKITVPRFTTPAPPVVH